MLLLFILFEKWAMLGYWTDDDGDDDKKISTSCVSVRWNINESIELHFFVSVLRFSEGMHQLLCEYEKSYLERVIPFMT